MLAELPHHYLFQQTQLSDASYVYLELIYQCGTLYKESAGMNVRRQEEIPAWYIGIRRHISSTECKISLQYLYVAGNATTNAWFNISVLPWMR